MAIPDFQTLMLPLLQLVADGKEHSIHEFVAELARQYGLSAQDLAELLPSGKQPKFYNRVGWTRTHLSKAGLLEATRRSYYRITDRGRTVLMDKPARIDMKYLRRFPEYVEFKDGTNGRAEPSETREHIESSATPEEVLEDAYQVIRENLALDLLVQVKSGTPAFFERLVVEVLVKMGYGGSHREAARAVGQTGDEGIDGIIDEDRLGLDTIYIQAKRWDSIVGRPEIQKFVGALMGKRARKGIFITTSTFSSEAKSYVENIDSKVVLIDGKRLTNLMIDYDVGVAQVTSYQIKRVDSDYFGVT